MQRSRHFLDMLKERNIEESWVDRCEQTPDKTEDFDDHTRHYIKQISEYGNRWLRVIVNIAVNPPREVTVFFDRRLRRKHENKS